MHLDRAAPGQRTLDRISAQARLIELRQAAKDLARPTLGGLFPSESLERLARDSTSPWDRALFAVLASEDGDTRLGRKLALEGEFPGGEAFRRCYRAAYLSKAPAPAAGERAEVRTALRNGYAARLLEARLQEAGDPGAAGRLRERGARLGPAQAGGSRARRPGLRSCSCRPASSWPSCWPSR